MDANNIFQLITDVVNTLGFPALMCGYFIWDKYKTTSPLVNAINKNTEIIERLADKMDMDVVADEN